MATVPRNISNLGFLTLFASIGLLFFAAFAYQLTTNGIQSGIPFTLFEKLLFSFWVGFAVAGLALSVPLLAGINSKRLWYALMSYWFSILIFWLWFIFRDISGTWRGITAGLYSVILGPLAYSICCIAYFLTKNPKRYFHLEKNPLAQLRC